MTKLLLLLFAAGLAGCDNLDRNLYKDATDAVDVAEQCQKNFAKSAEQFDQLYKIAEKSQKVAGDAQRERDLATEAYRQLAVQFNNYRIEHP